jgi:hypothetical protein
MRVAAQPVTPANANVAYSFDTKALASGEDIAVSFTAHGTTIPQAVDNVANKLFIHEENFLNLAWAAGDLVFFQFGRDVGVDSNLTGDLYVYQLSLAIPVF